MKKTAKFIKSKVVPLNRGGVAYHRVYEVDPPMKYEGGFDKILPDHDTVVLSSITNPDETIIFGYWTNQDELDIQAYLGGIPERVSDEEVFEKYGYEIIKE